MHSAQIAAFCYKALASSLSSYISSSSTITDYIKLYIFGPMHHVHYGDALALSRKSVYETPLGPLALDRVEIDRISECLPCRWLSSDDEEDEHSIEMQLPILYFILSQLDLVHRAQIIPILVSGLSSRDFIDAITEQLTCRILSDPNSYLIISSDFCHFGPRFNFNPSPEKILSLLGPVNEDDCVAALDRVAIKVLESGSLEDWLGYLKETGNTICGRQPLKLLMAGKEHFPNMKIACLKYHRNLIKGRDGSISSSVSYAALCGGME